MAPKSSSASAATRKKHAKKSQQSAPPASEPLPPVQPKQKKDKKAPKIKSFVPPPTYRGELDPVDIYKLGLHGSPVKPERAVILRKLGKKDPTTVERGLDEWIHWINVTFDPASPNHQGLDLYESVELVATVPVLIHHFSRLVAHPSRRVRSLLWTLFNMLVNFQHDQDYPCRPVLLNPAELEKPEYIGSWIISLWDPDKTVRTIATKVWNELVDLDSEQHQESENKVKLIEYDSEILLQLIELIQAPDTSNSQELGTSQDVPRKVAVLSESLESTSCRLRASAFEALAHLLRIHVAPQKLFDSIINSSVAQPQTWKLILPNTTQESQVRKAMWTVIQTLCTQELCRPLLESLVLVFSFWALRAAFTEKDFGVQGAMISGLVPLLKIYPQLWWTTSPSTLTQSSDPDSCAVASVEVTDESNQPSTIDAFYEFLELGCSGNPTLLYPALILLLNSFPITKDRADSFFSHFWVPYDTHILRAAGTRGLIEFSCAWSECLLLFERKLAGHMTPLHQRECDKVWAQIGDSGDQSDAVFKAFSSALIKVIHQSSLTFDSTWAAIEITIQQELDQRKVFQYLRFLSHVHISHAEDHLGIKAKDASVSLSHRVLNHLNGLSDVKEQAAWIPVLTSIIHEESSGRGVINELSLVLLLEFCQGRLPSALWGGSKPHYNLLLNILQSNLDSVSSTAWLALAGLNHFESEFVMAKQSIISGIFGHVTKLNPNIQLPSLGIDQFILKCLEKLLQSNTTFQTLLEPAFKCPQLFIKDETVVNMLLTVHQALHEQVNLLPHDLSSINHTKLHTVLSMCYLQLQHYDQITPACQASLSTTLNQTVIDLFAAWRFLELVAEESAIELVKIAHDAHLLALQLFPTTQLQDLYCSILQLICNCLTDVKCSLHPFDLIEILRLFLEQHCELGTQDFLSMLPIGKIGHDALTPLLTHKKFTPLLAMIDCLHQSTSTSEGEDGINLVSKYNRIVLAILDLLIQDRRLAQNHLWLWSHCMYIGELARYTSLTRTSIAKADHTLHQDELLAIVSAVDTNTTYFVSSLSTCVTANWHSDMIMKLNQPEEHLSSETDPLKTLIFKLAFDCHQEATQDLATVAFHKAISILFKYSDTSIDDFEKWLIFARQLQSSRSNLCLSLIQSLKSYLFANEKFQKYQNWLASKLTDVPSSKANIDGLELIDFLCATAPPPDSVHIFLPQQRVIFLLQAIGGWLKSDDDLEIVLNTKLLELFSLLAPIVQSVMGTHWEQMIDLVAINLEDATWDDEESLLLVWRSCLLIRTLQNILRHNPTLQSEIGSQVKDCMKLVLKLFCSAPFQSAMPTTTIMLLHTIEDVLQDKEAESLYFEAPIPQLANAIFSPSMRSGVLGLIISQAAVKHLIDNLAIELELNPEITTLPSLPVEILNLVEVSNVNPTRNLLGWILIISYFKNASSRLKNSYSAQLRDINLVSEHLIPLLHQVLQVAERGKPIDIMIWDIPSFDLSFLEDGKLKPIPLASYVYFLALQTFPSHIRSWWEGCRNKQLSMSVGGFISRHFSPLLISQELDKLKERDILKSLTDENLSIKVSPVIKEVKVTYTVDDESMEIVIRIPSDYPLQPVEVLDIRKIGIPETTWRAWLLVVQQSIANHNGSIADAIVLFKKNICLHFEGVEACAICYAIISVVDRSLPSKACRTCRNRFHPSCLYKWFSTSHGSSCPLCRSLF